MEQFDISGDTSTLLDDQSEEGQVSGKGKGQAGNDPRVRPIGYRWIASRGKKACPKCAALHNKVFYFDPQPGQASVEEMPRGQLHPNCRCTQKPILDIPSYPEKLQTIHSSIKPYMKNVYRIPGIGLIVRKSGSSYVPIWGKYCGPGWTGGRDGAEGNADLLYDLSPEDSLDEACLNHDNCYDKYDQHGCDKKLIDQLLALPSDPRKWPNPPITAEEISDANNYIKAAMFLFAAKYAWHEYMHNRRED